MFTEEQNAEMARRNKTSQIQLSLGISKVIKEVFQAESRSMNPISEEATIQYLYDRWEDAIRNYLNGPECISYNTSGLVPKDFVPVIDEIDRTIGQVRSTPSLEHSKLSMGEYLPKTPIVIYEPKPKVVDVDPVVGELGVINGKLCEFDGEDWAPTTDPVGKTGFVITGKADNKQDGGKEITSTTPEWMLVSWEWAHAHPDELRPGMIAYPDGEVIAPGSNISIYQANGSWLSVPHK